MGLPFGRLALPTTDLSASDFAAQLKLHGFAHLPQAGGFIDLQARAPSARPALAAVMAGRRLNRKATLAALFKARAARLQAAERAAKATAARERRAAKLAPVALPRPRATLSGAAAIAALADDFLVITTRDGAVTLPDLLRLGWPKATVIELVDSARALAYARQGGNAA